MPRALYVRVDTTRSLQQCKGRGAHQSDKSNNLSQELGDTLRQRAGQHFPTGNGSCLNRGTNQLGGVTHQGEQPGCLGEKLGDALRQELGQLGGAPDDTGLHDHAVLVGNQEHHGVVPKIGDELLDRICARKRTLDRAPAR